MTFTGRSQVVDPTGKTLINAKRKDESLGMVEVYPELADDKEDMIAEQKSFIEFQKTSLTKYDVLLTRSTQLVDDATKNTDRALAQIKFYKLLSVGGILVGTAGVLIGVGLAIK